MIRSFIYDDQGWLGTWLPSDYDGGESQTVAHDFMDHPLRVDNGLLSEALAFGSIYYSRIETGYYRSSAFSTSYWATKSDVDYMKDDIALILRNSYYSDVNYRIPEPPKVAKLEFEGDTLITLADQAYTVCFEELKQEYEENEIESFKIRQDADRAINWMRIGYNRTKRRFKNVYAIDLAYAYERLRLKLQENDKKLYENGTMMTVRLNNNDLSGSLTFREPWDVRGFESYTQSF